MPRLMDGPASCEVTVHDSQGKELGSFHCLPYSPYKCKFRCLFKDKICKIFVTLNFLAE